MICIIDDAIYVGPLATQSPIHCDGTDGESGSCIVVCMLGSRDIVDFTHFAKIAHSEISFDGERA